MVHRVAHLSPIGGDEDGEEHNTYDKNEEAHHNQRALDALFLPSFTQELRTEPDQAGAGKLGAVFSGHLFEERVEVRVTPHEEAPNPAFSNRSLALARARKSITRMLFSFIPRIAAVSLWLSCST